MCFCFDVLFFQLLFLFQFQSLFFSFCFNFSFVFVSFPVPFSVYVPVSYILPHIKQFPTGITNPKHKPTLHQISCAPTTKKLISVFYLCSIAALGLVFSCCSNGKQKVHTIFSQAAIQIRNAPWQMWKIALKLCGATLKRCIVPFLEVWVEGKSKRSFPPCFVWICMNVASCRGNISKGRI